MIFKTVSCQNPKCYNKGNKMEIILPSAKADNPLCEYCGDRTETVFSPTPTIFKSTGWFSTDGKY